jgi:hypothetical protein
VRTGFAWWVDHIHPDDRARTVASAKQAMNDAAVEIWTGEYRFRAADGGDRDVVDRAIMLRDAAGRCVGGPDPSSKNSHSSKRRTFTTSARFRRAPTRLFRTRRPSRSAWR